MVGTLQGQWVRRLVVLAVATTALVCASGGAAWAHASFVSATPGPGTGLPQAPGSVVLRFTEPLVRDASGVTVLDQAGNEVVDGPTEPVEGDARAMRRDLGLLAPGVYRVEWTTVSPLDGHTLKGSYQFSIGGATSGDAVVSEDPWTSEGPVGLAGTWVALAGLAVWFGGAVLGDRARGAGVPSSRLQRVARASAGMVALGTAATLASTSVGATASLDAVASVVLGSGSGRWSLVVVVAALARWLVGRRVGLQVDLLLATLAVVAEAASGHAGSNPQPVLATFAFAVHLAVVGAWLFAIVAALLAREDRRWVLARFTPPAVLAAVAAGATGVASAWLELTGFSDLLTTAYGQTVLAKGAVFVGMALLGLEHWRRRRRGDAEVVGVVRAEAVVALVAVGVATVLVGFPNPPREAATAAAANDPTTVLMDTLAQPAVSVAGRSGPYVVGVTVTPPGPGDVEVVVQVEGVEPGDGIRGVEVAGTGPGTAETALQECGVGCFSGRLDLSGRGDWTLQVTGRTNAEPLDTSVTIPLPAEEGRQRFQAMLEGTGQLSSARVREELRSRAEGDPIVSRYRYVAPDRMRWDVGPTGSTPDSTRIAIGDTGYLTDPDQPSGWKTYDWIGEPFSWPEGFYRDFFTDATAIRVLGSDKVDGVPTTLLAFTQPTYPAWYRVWVDDQDRLRRLEMLADAHFMDQTFTDLNADLQVRPPVDTTATDDAAPRTRAG